MKIGNVALENNVFLAPMAGVTDLPFRILCKEMGCGLVYSEMVSAKGSLYDNKNTTELLEVDPKERPVAVQLFGSDPEILGAMAKKIEEYPSEHGMPCAENREKRGRLVSAENAGIGRKNRAFPGGKPEKACDD